MFPSVPSTKGSVNEGVRTVFLQKVNVERGEKDGRTHVIYANIRLGTLGESGGKILQNIIRSEMKITTLDRQLKSPRSLDNTGKPASLNVTTTPENPNAYQYARPLITLFG